MFLRLWVLTVIDRLDFFFFRNRQDGGANIKRIDKIGQEIELAWLAILFRLWFILIHGEDHFFIPVILEIVMIMGIITFT